MYKRTLLILVGIVSLCALLTWIVTRPEPEVVEVLPGAPQPLPTLYISSTTNKTVSVTRGDKQITINGEGYRQVVLLAVPQETDLYKNAMHNILGKISGDNFTLIRGREEIFKGQNQETLPQPTPLSEVTQPVEIVETATSTEEQTEEEENSFSTSTEEVVE